MNNSIKRVPQALDTRYVEMDHSWNANQPVQPYDPYWANYQQANPPEYLLVDTRAPQPNALTPMGMLAHSLQNVFQMQMTMLRDLDARMNRVEQTRTTAPSPERFYAQTWWALWGILMLILGSALVVVLLLIFK